MLRPATTLRMTRTSPTPGSQVNTQPNANNLPNDIMSAKLFLRKIDEANKKGPTRIINKLLKRAVTVQPRIRERSSASALKYLEELKDQGTVSSIQYEKTVETPTSLAQNLKTLGDQSTSMALSSRADLFNTKSNFFDKDKKFGEVWTSPSYKQNRVPLKLYPIESPDPTLREKPEEYEEFVPIRNIIRYDSNPLPYKKDYSEPTKPTQPTQPTKLTKLTRTESAPNFQKFQQQQQQLQQSIPIPVFVQPLRGGGKIKNNPYKKKQKSMHNLTASPQLGSRGKANPSKDVTSGLETEQQEDQITVQKELIERYSYQNSLNFSANYGSFLVRKSRSSLSSAAVNADLSHARNKTLGVSNFQLKKKIGMMDYRNMNPRDLQKLLYESNNLNLKSVIGDPNMQELEWDIDKFLAERKKQQKQLEEALAPKKVDQTALSKLEGDEGKEFKTIRARVLAGSSQAGKRRTDLNTLKAGQPEYYDVINSEARRTASVSKLRTEEIVPSLTDRSMVSSANQSRHFPLTIERSFNLSGTKRVPSSGKTIKSLQMVNKGKEMKEIGCQAGSARQKSANGQREVLVTDGQDQSNSKEFMI